MQTIASFFTGCGGLDIGLQGGFKYLGRTYKGTGLKTVFACDIEEAAKRAYDANTGSDHYHVKSIVDFVKEHGNNPIPSTDIVTGGFPCQDFSLSGKRKGFASYKDHLGVIRDCAPEESRGMLYYWMCEVVNLTRPSVFIAENVKGLITTEGAPETIKSDFAKFGYVIQDKVLNSSHYSVPQKRERYIIIGVLRERLSKTGLAMLAENEHSLFPLPKALCVKCREAFHDLEEPEVSADPSQQSYSKAAYMVKGQGQIEVKLDGFGPTIRSEHHGNIEFRRLSEDHGGKYLDELARGMTERRLTVRECARIQSFPDDFEFLPHVSGSEAYKMIGNAVPPVMAHAIGSHLAKKWDLLFR